MSQCGRSGASFTVARTTKALKRFGVAVLAVLGLVFAVAVWAAIRTPIPPSTSPLLVNDVSQLNPVLVGEVITPSTTDEIVDAVRRSPGPIAIGGARHSMGGQIATAGALHIDMRRFNRIPDFSPAARTITVQAGTRWRQIQEAIDPANLSVAIMQSYANFTVGGSLSVNGHGRYVGLGPLIRSVKSIKVVLADGSLVDASPSKRADVFNGVIGGYGGLGVIVEATLELTDNVRVKRSSDLMEITSYKQYFFDRIRGRPSAVLHSANIFPDDYTMVRAVTLEETDDPATVEDRLIPADETYRLNRLAFWVQTEWPFGKLIGQHVIDPT